MARPCLAVCTVLLLAIAVLPAVEVPAESSAFIVGTPWNVRRDTQELLADLSQRRGGTGRLFDRVHDLLRDHGTKPLYHQGAYSTIAAVVLQHLAGEDLIEDFRDHFAPIAARRLVELRARGHDAPALRRLAISYPGTDAAREAWRLLADHAWDHGQLGIYLIYAERAGEADDHERAGRMAAARRLLAPPAPGPLPTGLADLRRVWTVPDLPPPPRPGRLDGHGVLMSERVDQRDTRGGLVFSRHGRTMVAASDGHHFLVLDPLLGDRLGPIHKLGVNTPATSAMRPVHADDRFVALGLGQDIHPLLVAVDDGGAPLWRTTSTVTGGVLSAPAVSDGLVAFAVVTPAEGGSEVHLVAHSLADGSLAWDTLIGKNTIDVGRRFSLGPSQQPSLCVHGGAFMVLSNNGLVARVGSDGIVLNIYDYGRLDIGGAGAIADFERDSAIMSDGEHLVWTPSDRPGVFILPPGAKTPNVYADTGAWDQLGDLHDGDALLIGKRVTLLAADSALARWSVVGWPGAGYRHAVLGPDHALVNIDRDVRLYRRQDGTELGGKSVDPHERVAVAAGFLLSARLRTTANIETQMILGYGDRHSYQRLLEAAQNKPKDYRPRIGLASHHRSRSEDIIAYDYLIEALALGAPRRHAKEAARIATRRTQLALGDEERFPTAIARLETLAAYLPGLALEVVWWRSRQAELVGARERAIAGYRRLRGARHRLTFPGGLAMDIDTLARLSLARLGLGTAPAWLQHRHPAPHLDPHAQGWSSSDRFLGEPLVAGDLAIAYTGGDLIARDLKTGNRVWRRQASSTDDAMLGVRLADRNALAQPVRIEVIPGSAADAAGMEDGDLLVSFNDHPINTFQDLINAVAATGIGQPFTARVSRTIDGAPTALDLRGLLGSYMVEAFAANGQTLLVRRLTLREDNGLWRVIPDYLRKPYVEAYDLKDGRLLWHRDLPTSEYGERVTDPLLSNDDRCILLTEEGIEAIDLRAEGNPVAWRLPLSGGTWSRAERIGEHLLAVFDPFEGLANLVRLSDGLILATIPAASSGSLLLDGSACYLRLDSGHLARWDLDRGSRRWRTELSDARPLAVRRGILFVRDRDQRLILLDADNGSVRGRYGEYVTVHDSMTSGDQLYVHATDSELDQVIGAVGLGGGTVRWSLALPRDLEIRGDLIRIGDGVACVLDALEQRPGILVLHAEGHIRQAHSLREHEQVIPTTAGILAHGPRGMRLLGNTAPARPEPLPCPPISGGEDLEATARAVRDRLSWTAVGDASLALAHDDGDLLVFARMPIGCAPFAVYLGDAGPAIDPVGQHIRFSRDRVPELTAHDHGWQQRDATMVGEADGQRLFAIRLYPSLLRTVGTPLMVKAVTGSDTSGGPWWWRRTWRLVDWRDEDPTR